MNNKCLQCIKGWVWRFYGQLTVSLAVKYPFFWRLPFGRELKKARMCDLCVTFVLEYHEQLLLRNLHRTSVLLATNRASFYSDVKYKHQLQNKYIRYPLPFFLYWQGNFLLFMSINEMSMFLNRKHFLSSFPFTFLDLIELGNAARFLWILQESDKGQISY